MKTKPIVYSCSGCSSVAQLANDIAVTLDREDIAEMSCIAGIGGDVPSIIKKAKGASSIVAIDGCHLRCAKNSLARHQLIPSIDIVLTDFGFKKKNHKDCDTKELMLAYKQVREAIASKGDEEHLVINIGHL